MAVVLRVAAAVAAAAVVAVCVERHARTHNNNKHNSQPQYHTHGPALRAIAIQTPGAE
jgi:hypothetical protein